MFQKYFLPAYTLPVPIFEFDPVTYSVAEGEQVSLRCVLSVATAFEVAVEITTSGSATRE